jgi:hypothetical protein
VSRPDLLHLWESVDLDLYLSGGDPKDSSVVVDHGSISESLQFSISSSLGLPLPSPSLCEKKGGGGNFFKKKKKVRTREIKRREILKKREIRNRLEWRFSN